MAQAPTRKRYRASRSDSEESLDLEYMKRSRSNSRTKLHESYRLLNKTILQHQHPVTGLVPAFLYSDGTPGWAANDAWVRDNVYTCLSIWGTSLAFRHQADSEEDRLTAFQLEQSSVKLMRGLLMSMMGQVDKVETFKNTLSKEHCLHAKYSIKSCSTVVGDYNWGHLQIDATSLYVLTLAQMTATGLRIIFNQDEVAFVQNLVFYIEEAYRIPDYGIWERGDKTNHGETELNSSSIGMAKAALQAISELDLFGSHGSQASVIHVMHDQVAQCDTKLNSLLPRESSSKEIDAALLTIVGFPAFAVSNPTLTTQTKEEVITKLLGNYGCKRFLRDGYQTVKEDSSRQHYESAELKVFENIECEWPLFLILLLLDSLITGNHVQAREYREQLNKIVPVNKDGLAIVPELYLVPRETVDLECSKPHSQLRVMGPKVQHMWSQSLFIVCNLLEANLLNIGEIDPLNRRYSMLPQPDTLIQIVLLSEDSKMRHKLRHAGIPTETISHLENQHSQPVKILPAKYLIKVYKQLGVSRKMGLTGRPPHMLGVIATSQLYTHSHQTIVFTPQFLDHEAFYMCLDNRLLVDLIRTDLAYLKSNWKLMGRPTIVLPLLWTMLGDESTWDKSPMFKLLNILNNGYTAGVRVQVGLMSSFFNTSSIRNLHFINPSEAVSILDLSLVTQKRHRESGLFQKNAVLAELTGKSLSLPLSRARDSIRKSRVTPPLQRRSSSKLPEGVMATTPEEPLLSLKVASAYHSRNRMGLPEKLQTDHSLHSSVSFGQLVRNESDKIIALEELVKRLQSETNIFSQADYLNRIHDYCGMEYKVWIGGAECSVSSLLEELYQKAGRSNMWSLVRHTAGMLHKRVEDLGPAATDLLVRQKNFSVGQPNKEIHIERPCKSVELLNKIVRACGQDHTAVALTQEIIVYLGMFIRSEPELFRDMLRLRVGLIRNVMVSELSRTMSCSVEQAVDRLHEFSPFDLKHLLHLILSRKEFSVDEIQSAESVVRDGVSRQLSIVAASKKRVKGRLQKDIKELGTSMDVESPVTSPVHHHEPGHWQRRRRLDGALNRVPVDFYSNVWHILERCQGIDFASTSDSVLPQHPTIQEMTPGELKFALLLESKLNSIPDPEYRQLVVEVLMVVGLVAKASSQPSFGHTPILVDRLINLGLQLFLQDQKQCEGPAMNCCCVRQGSCGGPNNICVHFYDSAPSGRYGTMSYIAQAVANQLRDTQPNTEQCKIS